MWLELKRASFYLLYVFLLVGANTLSSNLAQVTAVLLFFLLAARKDDIWLLLFFWLILIMSDNFSWVFAQTIKPFLLLGLTLYTLFNHFDQFRFNYVFKVLIPFFVLALFALSLSPQLGLSVQKYSSYILLVFCIPIVLSLKLVNKDLEFVKRVHYFTLVVLGLCLLSIVFYSGAFSHGGRLRGVFGNPNGLGMFCLFSLLFFEVSRKVVDVKVSDLEKYIFWIISISTLLLTRSRAALFAVLIFFFYARFFRISPWLSFLSLVIFTIGYESFSQFGTELIINLGLSKELRIEGTGMKIEFKSYFFSYYVPLVWLLRVLPERLGTVLTEEQIAAKEKEYHKGTGGFVNQILNFFHSIEIQLLKMKLALFTGTSMMIVLKKV